MPAAAAAPPAAAPPPATASPAAPTATPTPAPGESAEAALQKSMTGVESELYALDDGAPVDDKTPAAPPKAAKPEPPPKAEPPAEPESKAPEFEVPKEKPPQGGKTAADLIADEREPSRIVDLRTGYRTLKSYLKSEVRPKIAALEAELKKVRETAPQAGDLVKRLETAEKRNSELESQVEFLDFRSSKNFQEKYQKPYVEAWGRALADFQRLKVRVAGPADPETGEATVTTRPATQDDLVTLANMDLTEMDSRAHEMFGLSAARVIAHVEKIRDLAAAQETALADAQKSSEDRRKNAQTERTLAQTKRHELWQNSKTALATKYPRMFAEIAEDKEGNALLSKGRIEADRLFNPTEQNRFNSPEDAVRGHALMWQKIANHDRLAFWLKRARTEIAELKKSLAEFEQSEPPAGKAGGAAPVSGLDWQDQAARELAEIDKRG